MSPDDDADDDADLPRAPLPLDDRLWRHPSEMGLQALGAVPAAAAPSRPQHRAAAWGAVAVAGLAGAVLMAGVLSLSGQLTPAERDRRVVEKVAVSPIVSTPMLRGESYSSVAAVVRRLQPAIVRLDVTTAAGKETGSGVVFRDDGMVLTSAHLVDDAERVKVRLSDGRRLDGTVVGRDDMTDVAVIDLDATSLPVAVLGSAAGLEVGAATMVIGSPVGDAAGPAVSTGVISSLRRSIGVTGVGTLHGLLQTDAPIAPSSSGGALVDTSGTVIGIVTAFANDAVEEADRFGFATPIDLAHRVALQLIDDGKAQHGWLGVAGVDLSADEASSLGVPGGARVQGVEKGSPADRAGLGDDDVITEVDGHEVESMPDVAIEMRDHEPGDQVEIGYWRDGVHEEAKVTVGEHP